MRAFNLKGKYIFFSTALLFVVLGIFFYQNLKMLEEQIYENHRSKITMVTEVIKNGLITLMLEEKGAEFQSFLEGIVAEDIEAVRIVSLGGEITGSSLKDEIGGTLSDRDVYGADRDTGPYVDRRKKRLQFSMTVPLYNEAACQRCHGEEVEIIGVLNVVLSLEKTLGRLGRLRENAVLFYIVAIASLSLALWLLTTVLVNRPIRGIIGTMKRVEDGDHDVRFITKRRDEIGRLASSLNSMLEELDRARREVERYHMESMQRVEKMATVGELAAAIAHEIKNPLAGISGAIQVLAEDFSREDPRRDIILEVLNEIARLDKAVRDLLSFARPPELHLIKTQMSPIMERSLRLIAMRAEKQDVEVIKVPAENEGMVSVDPEQMQQVFLNIMLNALHSMYNGGTLTVSFTTDPVGETVQVAFADNGHGMEEKEIEDIFKPFYTTKQTGTGLGLAISKNIVEKHGGSIKVQSTAGEGSTFRVILPLMKTAGPREG